MSDGFFFLDAAGMRWRVKQIARRDWLVDRQCACELGVHRHNLGLLRAKDRDALVGVIAVAAGVRDEEGEVLR